MPIQLSESLEYPQKLLLKLPHSSVRGCTSISFLLLFLCISTQRSIRGHDGKFLTAKYPVF